MVHGRHSGLSWAETNRNRYESYRQPINRQLMLSYPKDALRPMYLQIYCKVVSATAALSAEACSGRTSLQPGKNMDSMGSTTISKVA